jgi:hypothetical protein
MRMLRLCVLPRPRYTIEKKDVLETRLVTLGAARDLKKGVDSWWGFR